jgi:hypothetical protein
MPLEIDPHGHPDGLGGSETKRGDDMRRVIHILIAGMAVAIATGSTAGSAAAALPTILYLTGEGPPVEFNSLANTFATKLENGKFLLEGEGIGVNLNFPTAGNLGTFKLTLAKVEDPQQENLPCDTAGAGAGNVVLSGAAHLVYDSLTVLGVAALLLFEEVIIACEAIAIRLKGNALGLIKPINREILTTEEAEFTIKCSGVAGRPEDRKWWNAAGIEQTALMEMNFAGTGFEESCLDVAGVVKLKPTKMVEIRG